LYGGSKYRISPFTFFIKELVSLLYTLPFLFPSIIGSNSRVNFLCALLFKDFKNAPQIEAVLAYLSIEFIQLAC